MMVSRSLTFLLTTCTLACLATTSLRAADDQATDRATARTDEESKFVRFLDEGKDRGRLDTSIVHYRNKDGVEVALISAVHIGDKSYYRDLQRDFAQYDVLLYEMIKDKDVSPAPGRRGTSMLSMFQRFLKDTLALEFQLDGIDYTKRNFVHADMDPRTFFETQKKKGESLLSLMFQSWKHEMKKQAEGKSTQPSLFELIRALTSKDSSRSLKYLFGRQLSDMEDLLAGLEGDDGSVIVAERNKVALRVLEVEIRKGRKKLGIFYGAAHMPDMERRLDKMGFSQVGEPRWLVAWDIGSRLERPDSRIPPAPANSTSKNPTPGERRRI